MKYIIVGTDENGFERKIGSFRRKKEKDAWNVFWREFASECRFPGFDLTLYSLGWFGKRKYITDDY